MSNLEMLVNILLDVYRELLALREENQRLRMLLTEKDEVVTDG